MAARAITQVCPRCDKKLVLPASVAGQKVPCTRCGAEVLIPGNPAVPVLPPFPITEPPAAHLHVPPHLAAQLAAQKPAASSVAAEPSEDATPDDETSQPQSWFTIGCLVLSILSIVATSILAVVVLAVWVSHRRAPQVALPENVEQEASEPSLEKQQFTNAAKKSASYAGLRVRIDKVEVGKVHYRSKGEILETTTPNYLIITLNVKNKSSTRQFEYKSWYSFSFEDEEAEQTEELMLVDENGLTLEVFSIPGTEIVERHIASSTLLEPGDETHDSLVFKLEEDYLDDPIPSLYLTLPIAAVADRGHFRFHIPSTMVQRRE